LFPAALAPYVLRYYAYSNYLDGGEAWATQLRTEPSAVPARNADQLLSAYTRLTPMSSPMRTRPGPSDFGGLLTFRGRLPYRGAAIPVPQLDVSDFLPRIQAFEPGDDPLQTMRLYWTQFAKTGNPNVVGKPAWPAYNATSDRSNRWYRRVQWRSLLQVRAPVLCSWDVIP